MTIYGSMYYCNYIYDIIMIDLKYWFGNYFFPIPRVALTKATLHTKLKTLVMPKITAAQILVLLSKQL